MLKKHDKKINGLGGIMTENMSKDAIIHAWEAQMKVKLAD
jgi:hexosaminidase